MTRRAVLIQKPTGRIRGGRWLGCVRLFGAQTVANGPGTNGVTIVLPSRRVPSAATRAIYPSQGSPTCHRTAQGAVRICPASASSAVRRSSSGSSDYNVQIIDRRARTLSSSAFRVITQVIRIGATAVWRRARGHGLAEHCFFSFLSLVG